MNNNADNQREKLLLHSLVDTVKEQTEKIDNVENAIPTKTSDLQNDSGFLTSHQDISGKENTTNKTQTINENSTNLQYPTAKAVFDLMEENMINTTDLENEIGDLNTTNANINTTIGDLNTTNTNLTNTLGDKLQALTVAVLGIGADFSQVEATVSDVKSGKKFFDDEGVLQTGTITTYDGGVTITENGTLQTANKFLASDLTVAVPRPQLNAPTLALSGDTLTITNTNGNFIVNFEIYADNTLLCTTANASIDLSDYLENPNTYSITAICTGTNFEDSLASQSVSYTLVEQVLITNINQISSLNTKTDGSIFNNSTHEKLPFTSKGANGPTAVIFFRQSYGVALTPTITLQFFLRDIPANASTLPCNIKLNDTIISNTALSVVSGQSYDATITLSNLTSSSFNKLEIEFNDVSLSTMQLDYLDITITNTQNCIILNRDDSFCFEGFKTASGDLSIVSSNIIDGIYKYTVGRNKTFSNIINPTTTFHYVADNHGNPVNKYVTTLACYKASNDYTTISAEASAIMAGLTIANTNELWYNYTIGLICAKIQENIMYISGSVHNGEINYQHNLCGFWICIKTDLTPFLAHYEPNHSSYYLTLNNQNIPSEFISASGIKDWFMRQRTTNVNDIGYFLIHKSGNILFFPKVNNTYCLNIGKGRQVNAYLSEDGLSINVYYNVDDKVIKKVLTRDGVENSNNWTLQFSTTEYLNTKDLREYYQTYIYQDLTLTWNQNNNT